MLLFTISPYLIVEVKEEKKLEFVDVYDNLGYYRGKEPQKEMEFKEPGECSMNNFVGTLYGEAALHSFKKGEQVAVSIRLRKKGDGTVITIEDIKRVKNLEFLCL